MAREVVIVGAARTPIGSFQGALSKLTAPQLGAVAIKAALERAGVKPEAVQEVIMGNVLQAGVGQAPARQATLFAGLPEGVPATTLNKVCGSGLKAVIAGAQAIALGEADVVVVGGMESMSNAPYISHTMRGGARMGNVEFKDAMIHDGLWDVYGNVHMGNCAEECATSQNISRAQQDEFALESTRRAIQSQKEGLFAAEIVPVVIPGKKPGEETTVSEDEGPRNAKPDKIPGLKPVFKKDGTVTAANASSINDGAAALVLMSEERAKAEGKTILGRITGYAQAARKPVEFTIAPADAINTLLTKKGVKAADVDLWEINEAFAVVSIANNRILGLDPAKVNVRGGGVVLGHPIGASGARVLVTLLQTMKDQGKKRGVASLCIGGGEGIALMVER
ncbi:MULTISPECIES: acetyl-CoA C-acetyltransferase [unclassified Myxococcus]|uniref:thiolase family protein n=1 Tax=Myxococcus TaxID=32 RepID=UPI001CC12341|nr:MULTISPECIES: acetyl-CoA C-acetyltransferase [unclassified Myxococcus]MBZ4397424.1 acetyl-CoA C-acetyltransferase [Myxococcus sp. AS-1-15]MBZ4410606.1 acetyl-CoA C-acetyltransferase [Myxococcus sp. XM-1-1-1]BDT34661.1 acetyl-CoA C-acetyltransferase [Myxococcus sp. MH1]